VFRTKPLFWEIATLDFAFVTAAPGAPRSCPTTSTSAETEVSGFIPIRRLRVSHTVAMSLGQQLTPPAR
jgi:hypothetical protein